MRVGCFSPSVLLRVAERSGVLARHRLHVEESAVPSSPEQFRGLADGSLDAALTSPDNVVAYRFAPDNPLGRLLDARVVAGVDRGLGLGLYARPGTGSVRDLRDAVVGVDVTSSGFAFALYEILDRAGLRAGRDCRLVELGSTPRRLEALLDGRCDATMLNAGNDLRAVAAGLPRLALATDVARPYLGTVLAVAGEPTDEVRRLAAALAEASAGLLDGTTRPLAEKVAGELGLPQGLAVRYADQLTDPDQGLVVEGDVSGLETVVALRRRHRPCVVDGVDRLAAALDPAAGLVDRRPA